jgi:fatty acid desaturase
LEREQARLRRQIRHQRFWDGVANLPWLVLLRVALITAVIAFLVFLWSMRYTILNAILEFFIELLPVVLVIAAIVYLIRSIFRP